MFVWVLNAASDWACSAKSFAEQCLAQCVCKKLFLQKKGLLFLWGGYASAIFAAFPRLAVPSRLVPPKTDWPLYYFGLDSLCDVAGLAQCCAGQWLKQLSVHI